MIIAVASVQAKQTKVREVRQGLQEDVEYFRQQGGDVSLLVPHEGTAGQFAVVFRYENESAREKFGNTVIRSEEGQRRIRKNLENCVEGSLEQHVYDVY